MDDAVSLREEVLRLAADRYSTDPDYPWQGSPDAAVLRHRDTKKWFGLLMRVRRRRLGLPGEEETDVLNVKADPRIIGSFRGEPGVLPAYHMNKESWLTILLDGTVPLDTVAWFLDQSYDLTKKKPRAKNALPRNTEWLVPANPRYYDIEHALWESGDDTFLWKQSSAVHPGDTVYLYVAAPFSAIRYKCRAVETDIPWEYVDENVRMKKVMRLRLLRRYDGIPIDRRMLERYGIVTVRGPRGIPNTLVRAIEALYPETESDKP